jgi:hypothetical protein
MEFVAEKFGLRAIRNGQKPSTHRQARQRLAD